MRISGILLISLTLLAPFPTFAEEQSLTRRDGFLLIWQGISRAAEEASEAFADVPEGADGALEINFARARGILDRDKHFRPNDPLLLSDALLWSYRTRNVAELPDMEAGDLPRMMEDFPVAEMGRPLDALIFQQELMSLLARLDTLLRDEVHTVSYYADDFHGNGTAFGDTFDMHAMTAAHRSFPENTLVRVRNVENGRSVVVRINDRGPYVDDRDMDLSLAAFEALEDRSKGVLRAIFERLGDIALVDRCQQERRLYQKRVTGGVRFHRGIPHHFITGEELVLQANKVFLVLGVTEPDGTYTRIQNFVYPEEKFRFTPSRDGRYVFIVGDGQGRVREMRMDSESCPE